MGSGGRGRETRERDKMEGSSKRTLSQERGWSAEKSSRESTPDTSPRGQILELAKKAYPPIKDEPTELTIPKDEHFEPTIPQPEPEVEVTGMKRPRPKSAKAARKGDTKRIKTETKPEPDEPTGSWEPMPMPDPNLMNPKGALLFRTELHQPEQPPTQFAEGPSHAEEPQKRSRLQEMLYLGSNETKLKECKKLYTNYKKHKDPVIKKIGNHLEAIYELASLGKFASGSKTKAAGTAHDGLQEIFKVNKDLKYQNIYTAIRRKTGLFTEEE